MRILNFLRQVFMFPSDVLMIIITIITMFKFFKQKIRSDAGGEYLSNSEVYIKAATMTVTEKDLMLNYLYVVKESTGVFKYIFSTLCWYSMYNLIF